MKDFDVAMPTYNLLKYKDDYQKRLNVYGIITEMMHMLQEKILNHLNVKQNSKYSK